MITIFNRRLLQSTFSMEEQGRIRNSLADNGIDYTVNTVNRHTSTLTGSPRSRIGSVGENPSMNYEYLIYVKKADYDKAVAVINGQYRR